VWPRCLGPHLTAEMHPTACLPTAAGLLRPPTDSSRVVGAAARRAGGRGRLMGVPRPPRRPLEQGRRTRATPAGGTAGGPPQAGQRYSRERWDQDSVEYLLRGHGHELRVVLSHLSERETARIGGEGHVELALVVEPLVFTVLARFDGVIPWSGAPFSWHQLPGAERVLPAALEAGEEAALTVVLVEASDGIVRAVRPLALSAEFSLALDAAIRDQGARPFVEADHHRQAAGLYTRWQAGDLVDRATARWSSTGRPPTWGG
jgi:hypothetical protein